MTIEEMKKRKKERGYSNEHISELSGVPLGTVNKVFSGATKAPRYETLCALEKVFEEKDIYLSRGKEGANVYADTFNEAALPYRVSSEKTGPDDPWPNQGRYTLDDYFALPDEKRVELIDGVFYDMASPTSIHQLLADELRAIFAAHIKKNKGKCFAITSPLDVQLDKDNRTMVQPDVVIICDRAKFQNGRIYGAPELTVEVLSKSTRSRDMILKLNKYNNAGVREYWIVDPKKKTVTVYKFGEDIDFEVYTFSDRIPVGIFNDECVVDFSEIYEYVSFFYEGDNIEE